MKLPETFLQSLEGVAGFDREAFVAVHEKEGGVTTIRLNPSKWPDGEKDPLFSLQDAVPVPWSRYGYYLAQRPSFTFDPLFHAGCYYVQEASSMFLEQALTQLADLSQPLKVLDLCASPGGKSTHIQSLLSADSLLVSNEVIKARSLVLTDNLTKWGSRNVIVTNNDPRAFQKTPGYFDVMVVDAPCSGSGLFRKDEDAIAEWSPNNVALCSQRQQRILADALPALKENGLLVYSTCSYSPEEDELIMDWLVKEKEMENLSLNGELSEGIVLTESIATASIGYRFYPDKLKGEGFFLACFRKKSGEESSRYKALRPQLITAKEKQILQGWIDSASLSFLPFRNGIIALPEAFVQDWGFLQSQLNMVYAGVAVGEILKERLIPHHALAQSLLLAATVPTTELSYEDAIKYLQKQEFSCQPERQGWQVVRYQKHKLGWINTLKNRVNNYYPKEIRILKQNNTAFKK